MLGRATANADLTALIKPQFEVGRNNLGKGSIVRDEELRWKVIGDVTAWLSNDIKWHVFSFMPSNLEYAQFSVIVEAASDVIGI